MGNLIMFSNPAKERLAEDAIAAIARAATAAVAAGVSQEQAAELMSYFRAERRRNHADNDAS